MEKGVTMSTINSVNPAAAQTTPAAGLSTTSSPSSIPEQSPVQNQDKIELSLAGRIALGVSDGTLTSAQGQQLDSEFQTINQTVESGGSASQLESQLSQAIYGDAHNGATIPTGLTVTAADLRDFEQAGRVAYQESAGNLTSAQGSQFLSQIGQIYQQSVGDTPELAINQAQNQLSVEIYDTAHNITPPTPAS
jgi:hypothetical protein